MRATNGMLILTLMSCAGLPKADLMSASDPYVVFDNGISKSQSQKTSVIQNNNDPVWKNETLTLTVSESTPVEIRIYDEDDFTADDLLCFCTLNVERQCDMSGKPKQFEIRMTVHERWKSQKKSPIFKFTATYNKLL